MNARDDYLALLSVFKAIDRLLKAYLLKRDICIFELRMHNVNSVGR